MNTGYMILVEANGANINGDPDESGAPRTDYHNHALISDVSVKKKIRKHLMTLGHEILETGRSKAEVNEIKKEGKLSERFIDVRLFGTTELAEDNRVVYAGPVNLPFVRSVAPVALQSYTHSIERGVEIGKDQGMAPDGFKYFEHALFPIEISYNQLLADRINLSEADMRDFELSLPHIYDVPSRTRPNGGVMVLRIYKWSYEGPNCDMAIREALTPVVNEDVEPMGHKDYVIPSGEEAHARISSQLKKRVETIEVIYDTLD